jgi:hypothetical protein
MNLLISDVVPQLWLIKQELKYDHAHLFIYRKYISKMTNTKHRHNDFVFTVNTVRNLSKWFRRVYLHD